MSTNILIVEDDQAWQDSARRHIEVSINDAFVTCVYSLEQAQQYLLKTKFDVVISSFYEFGDVEGAAYMTILQLANRNGAPVIFLSSYVTPLDAFKAAKLGAYDFLVVEKISLSIDTLLSTIQSALSMKQFPKVFISYSSKDKPFVQALANRLHDYGIRVWWDTWEIKIGDSVARKIEEGIATSSYLAIVLSPASVSSRWVLEELDAAMIKQIDDRKIHILPVLKEDCIIPPLLRSRRYADFRNDFESALSELIATINDLSKLNIGA